MTAAVGKSGVDVLYDPIGGAAFMQGLRCLKWGGHALVIGRGLYSSAFQLILSRFRHKTHPRHPTISLTIP